MNCAGCGHVLRSFEYAQPMQVFGRRVRPASMCDACCKANLTSPGSHEALERLARGQVDAAAQSRVAELTAQWQAPFQAVLEHATVPDVYPHDPQTRMVKPIDRGHTVLTQSILGSTPRIDDDADAWPSRMAYEPILDSEHDA